jgi:hypothetical protein
MGALRDDLIAAKALIDTPEKWRKDDHLHAGSCCAVVAVNRVSGTEGVWADGARPSAMRAALFDHLPDEWREKPVFNIAIRIGDFNDHPDTTHADVMALFDRAIASASPSQTQPE